MDARSVNPSIDGYFALIAIATLCRADTARGDIEFVTFYATDGCASQKWSANFSTAFVNGIVALVGNLRAAEILSQLRRNEPVLFPGTFTIDEIRLAFGRLRKAG